jgi:WD40 repeat protein
MNSLPPRGLLVPVSRLAALALLSALILLVAGRSGVRGEADAKEIGKLIEQLGDDDADTRKEAEKKLADIGESALPALRKAGKEHADPDVRLRALVLVRVIEKGVFGEIRKFTNHTGIIRSIAVSKDGKRALTGSQDQTVRLWEIDTGKELKKFTGHVVEAAKKDQTPGWTWSVCFSPDEKQVLSSGSFNKTLRLWDLENDKEVRKIESASPDPKPDPDAEKMEKKRVRVYGAAFSPDGRHVLSGEAGETPILRLYETETGKEVRTFTGHTGWVWRVAFSPDGAKIASAGCNDYSFRIWETESGKTLVNGAKAHKGFVVAIAFSPDGKKLLTSGRDMTVKLWDAESGKLLKTYADLPSNAESLAFSKDGKRFLAGARNVVLLYDTTSGKVLHRFEFEIDQAAGKMVEPRYLKGFATAVAFVDNRRALCGCDDTTVRLFGLPK